MIRFGKRSVILVLAMFVFSAVKADKLKDGFERLKLFDYFKAKEYFEKSLEKKPTGAAFGLSKIFSTENNPFFNLDSARKYILISDLSFKADKPKDVRYYSEFGVNDTSILALSENICEKYFDYVQKIDSVAIYDHFILDFGSCSERVSVVELRNAAAFRDANKINTSSGYKLYAQTYPDAKEFNRANELYQQRLFEEQTDDNTILSYEKFMADYPESPYKDEADRRVYRLSTVKNRVSDFASFARKYPGSKYSGDSWRQVYSLSMKEFTEAAFNSFRQNYPDYPFVSEMETDYKLQNYTFLPMEKNEKWGYINEEGVELISPQFDDAILFSEGLAVVTLNEKSGYIGKSGKVILPLVYTEAESFQNGYAIVMVDSLYGMINRKGEFVIKPEYDELGDVVEDVCIAVKDGKAGYISKYGKKITECVYDLANEFLDGFAIVAVDEKHGLINTLGKFVIEPLYDELIAISKNRMKASNNDKWGVIDRAGNTIATFIYDDIGDYNDGLALASMNGKYGYIDEQGVERIPMKYQYNSTLMNTGKFSNGYVLLRQKNKTLLADTSGAIISFPGVEQYGLPGQGLIPVMKNKKWGYADMTGKMKIQPKYDMVESFNNGIAKVKSKGFFGVIDSTGASVIETIYDNVIPQENYLSVVKESKFGALSKNATLILPCAYRSIDLIGNRILRGVNENRLIYVELSGKIIYVGDRE
ncbi:MAG: WG repeat-containing protein [Bacteroidia bacterium]|nr:WG repeat-containing protein [Bacteroidia bacterium]